VLGLVDNQITHVTHFNQWFAECYRNWHQSEIMLSGHQYKTGRGVPVECCNIVHIVLLVFTLFNTTRHSLLAFCTEISVFFGKQSPCKVPNGP